jgi:hypothetical protein
VCTENSEANRVRKKHNRAIIAADVRRFCHQIKQTKFSAHTGAAANHPRRLRLERRTQVRVDLRPASKGP